MFHNCALTSRYWRDYQIEKRAYIGEDRGEIQIIPKEIKIIFFIIYSRVLLL